MASRLFPLTTAGLLLSGGIFIDTFSISTADTKSGNHGAQYIVLDEIEEECLDCTKENRLCLTELESSTAGEFCGPCKADHVEYASKCLPIDDLVGARNWEHFLDEYKVTYSQANGNQPTINDRLVALKKSAELIASHNSRGRRALETNVTDDDSLEEIGLTPELPYELGITKFSADQTAEDYRSRSGYGHKSLFGSAETFPEFEPRYFGFSEKYPEKIDWQELGGVTKVKDQGRCGGSWAMSLAGALEGAIYSDASNKGYLRDLSHQQILACSEYNDGCNGGDMIWSVLVQFLPVEVASLDSYPFTDSDGPTSECLIDISNIEESIAPDVKIEEARRVAGMDRPFDFEERLALFKQAVQIRPISTVMRSSCPLLSNYIKGILTEDGECACSDTDCHDHAVVLVGYDDTAPIPYFKLKNSWGSDGWGEDGYFRVAQIPSETGQFGLFGILGEGLILAGANITVAAQDEVMEKEPTGFPWWGYFVIFLSIFILLLVFKFYAMKSARNHEGRQNPSSDASSRFGASSAFNTAGSSGGHSRPFGTSGGGEGGGRRSSDWRSQSRRGASDRRGSHSERSRSRRGSSDRSYDRSEKS